MSKSQLPTDASAPGEQFEVRNVSESDDAHPDSSKSIKLPNRQRLIDDIIDLYSMKPTVEKVKPPDCVYDDQFVYANNRYKMAGQWFALPKLFKSSVNEGYEITKNEPGLIQFKNEQTWTFLGIPKSATVNALVSQSIDPETQDSDFVRIKYHKDQANHKDYSHKGIGFYIKKWQADHVSDWMSMPEVKQFEADRTEEVRKYPDRESLDREN